MTVLHALTWRAREVRSPGFRLVPLVDGGLLARLYPLRSSSLARRSSLAREIAPFGWRAEWVWDRDCIAVMPAWVYYPRHWWRALRWRYFLLRHRDPMLRGKR